MKDISQVQFDPPPFKSSRLNGLTDFDALGDKLFVFSGAFLLQYIRQYITLSDISRLVVYIYALALFPPLPLENPNF